MGETFTSNAISFQRETLADTWEEGQKLVYSNHAETGVLPGEKFHLDRDIYFKMEQAGIVSLFTMRDDAQLVGYALFVTVKHPHYMETLWAKQDVLYVSPSHRGLNAVKFIEWTDMELKAEGADYVLRQATKKNDFSRTLLRMGYEEVETSYSRKVS